MPMMITRGAASAKGFGFTNSTKLGPLPDSSLNISQFTYQGYLDLYPSFTNIALPTSNPYVFTVSDDGKYFYINDYGSNYVYQFSMTIPFDITTATTSNYKLGYIGDGQNNGHMGMTWKPDGTAFIIGNYPSGPMVRFNVSTPWMVDTITSASIGNAPDTGGNGGYTRTVSRDGTKVIFNLANNVYTTQWNIGTPWNMTTLNSTADRSVQVDGYTGDRFQAMFSYEGQWFFVIDSQNKELRQYLSSTYFNIPNGGSVNASYSLYMSQIAIQEPAARLTEFCFVGDQRYMYVMQQRGNTSSRQIYCYAKLT